MLPSCQGYCHRLKNVTAWNGVMRAANTVASDPHGPSPVFLYQRAIRLALDGVSEWLHDAPERGFGMVVISYHNLADYYASRGDTTRHDHYREQATAFVSVHAQFDGAPERTRHVAQEYLAMVR